MKKSRLLGVARTCITAITFNTKTALQAAAVFTVVAFTGAASAAGGVFETDRLGYAGTVVRYLTEADARTAMNPQETIAIGVDVPGDDSREHRDARVYFVDDNVFYDTNQNILQGSWYYSINGTAGLGNINGNTGIGFMQIFDADGSTDTSISMDFSNFDGTHWTDFTLSAQGENATATADDARFSVYDNLHDAGTYLEYDLNITVSGLEGLWNPPGFEIVANNHPTGVNGSFSGLFQFGGDPDGDLYTGFYTIDLDFDMENWAFANNGSLDGRYQHDGNIFNSLFVSNVPVPAAVWLFGSGLLGLVGMARRKKVA